jgi:hypothetical protein
VTSVILRAAVEAETSHMIISDKQARLAFECLHSTEGGGEPGAADVAPKVPRELLERVNEALSEMPETRTDRVAQAKADLAGGVCSAGDVAHKIIARAICDSLR